MHTWVREDVGVALDDCVAWEGPVALCAARVVVVQERDGAAWPPAQSACEQFIIMVMHVRRPHIFDCGSQSQSPHFCLDYPSYPKPLSQPTHQPLCPASPSGASTAACQWPPANGTRNNSCFSNAQGGGLRGRGGQAAHCRRRLRPSDGGASRSGANPSTPSTSTGSKTPAPAPAAGPLNVIPSSQTEEDE